MADGTAIEWTDATVNAVNGCTVVSPGCKHCYAMKQAHRVDARRGLTQHTAGGMVWTGEVRLNEKALFQPLDWKRPRKIFWNAHGDLFHENVPDEWIDKVFAICALTPQHQHQILTKRPARMRQYMESIDNGDGERIEGLRSAMVEGMAQSIWHARTGDDTVDEWLAVHLPLPNVWLGTSVEDQQRADDRIPDLLATPAAVRFLSCEPLLGPVDLNAVPWNVAGYGMLGALPTPGEPDDFRFWHHETQGIRWVIVGGESGPKARPMHPDWARSLRDQCAAAGVPFFFKQHGEWLPFDQVRSDEQLAAVSATTIESARTGNGKQTVFGSWNDGEKWRGTPGVRPVQINRVGKKLAGRLLDGAEHSAMPIITGAAA